MRILGVDPGLRLTGYGVVDFKTLRSELVDGGVIRMKDKTPIPTRLLELERELDALFVEHKPDVCAVEQVYSHYAHPRTAILMGHARGVILLVAERHGARIEQLGASRVKQSVTGHGHASKEQMQRAIQARWNLPEPPDPPDVADALAIALCCGELITMKRSMPVNTVLAKASNRKKAAGTALLAALAGRGKVR